MHFGESWRLLNWYILLRFGESLILKKFDRSLNF